MWFASLLTAGAASFGRLLVVNLVPNALVLLSVWVFVRVGSFSGRSDWERLALANLKIDAFGVLVFVLATVVAVTILQPFQIRMIRLLEGYWDGWSFTARLAPLFREVQRRRLLALRQRKFDLSCAVERSIDRCGPLVEQAKQSRRQARDRSAMARVSQRMERYPGRDLDWLTGREVQIPLLPTALGNALRTAETSGGERYGLSTIGSWPRLYPHFSDKFTSMYNSARDGVDAASNLCISFFVAGIVSIVALIDEPKAYWIPAGILLLCFVSYIGAVAAATQHTTFVRVAYDLHRFDLVKAMHHKLPSTTAEERELFKALSWFFHEERWLNKSVSTRADTALRQHEYDHSASSPAADDGDDAAKAKDAQTDVPP